MVPGQWHEYLIEAVKDEARENRQKGLLLAETPQTERVVGEYPTFSELSAPRIRGNGIN